VGAELFHWHRQTDRLTDRWRDMIELIVVYCNFVNAPKTYSVLHFKPPDFTFHRLLV
jgi:hypothetical protein